MGHFYRTCVDARQDYYGTSDLVGNNFQTCWKCIGFFKNLLEATPAQIKVLTNNWIVLKRTFRCQLLLSTG